MEIVIERSKMGELLRRQGSSSSVYAYKDNKVLKVITVAQDEVEKKLNEVRNGSNHNHPHILNYDGYFVKQEEFPPEAKIFIEMSRMKETLGDCMESRFARSEEFSNEEIIKYSFSLMSGLAYLHQKKIAHRDIKPHNLFFNNELILKIGDHGISKKIQSDLSTSQDTQNRPCTKYYASPEVYEPAKLDWFKVDSWSAGLVILSLVQNKITFLPEGPYNNEKKTILKGILDSLETICEAPLARAIRELLAFDPEARKLPKDVLQLLEDSYPTILQEYKQRTSLLHARSAVSNIQGSNPNLFEEAKIDPSITLDGINKKWKDLMCLSHQNNCVSVTWTDLLSIKDEYLKGVTNDIASYFMQKDPSSIKVLNVMFFHNKKITKEVLGEHFNRLAKMFQNLELLDGRLTSSLINEDCTFTTPLVWKPFTTLKNFRVNNSFSLTPPQFQNWVNIINQNLRSLESFEFNTGGDWNFETLTILTSLKLPNLKALRFEAYIIGMTDKGITDFARSFAASPDLRRLQTCCLKIKPIPSNSISFEGKREAREILSSIPKFDLNFPELLF